MSIKHVIDELFETYNTTSELYKLYEDLYDKGLVTCCKESYKREVRRRFSKLNDKQRINRLSYLENEEIIEENVRLAKNKQNLQDRNRIQNTAFREYARYENSLEELNKSLIKLLEQNTFKDIKKQTLTYKPEDKVLIIQLSDLHIGEEVDLEHNKFNYEIAGKRLKMFANRIKEFSKVYKIKKLVLFATGDIINNDTERVMDKLLNNADNRTKVMFIASYLISQFIIDLQENYNIDVFFTVGNESRVKDTFEMPVDEPLLSHNYDYAIFNILKMLFKESKVIKFYNTNLDEAVINIYNHHFLITHGHNLKADNQNNIDNVIRKYLHKNIHIDYIVCGHIHETLIKNYVIRSGSLVGANKYSESKHFSSIASQNIIIVDDKTITPIPINLQYVDNIKGYNYPKNLEEYNSMFDKSSNKTTTILKIVI